MALILDCAWKATAVLALAGLISALLRREAAAVRHMVWAAALLSALAIPVVSKALPGWSVPMWRDTAPVLFRASAVSTLAPAAVHPPQRQAVPADLPRTGRGWPLFSIWLAGMAAVLLHVAASRLAVARLARRAVPAPESVTDFTRELCLELGISAPVRVLQTSGATTPMTWGIFRPVILLPASASEGLNAILIHELAHIARRDSLWQLLGNLACALYWFHPLVWLAQRQALRWRERASDDAVLRAGVRGSDYAHELVRLARTLALPRLCGSLAIARPSDLEQRVRAILDPSQRRRTARTAGVAGGLATAAVMTLVLACVRPVAAQGPSSFAQEESAVQDALLAAKVRTGELSADYARALANLGALYARWDRSKETVDTYTRAVPLLDRTLGATAPELFEPLRALAVQAQIREDWPQALELYQRAVEIGRVPPVPKQRLALALAELASAKRKTGDTAAAAALLEQAIAEAPADSIERAVVLEAQAYRLRAENRTAEADQVFREADSARAAWAALQSPSAPAPQADGKTIFKVSDSISTPKLVEKREPEYTAEARVNHWQGMARLSIVIDEQGRPRDIAVVKPVGLGLDQRAVEAVRQWKFEPARKDGKAVAALATVEINFRLL